MLDNALWLTLRRRLPCVFRRETNALETLTAKAPSSDRGSDRWDTCCTEQLPGGMAVVMLRGKRTAVAWGLCLDSLSRQTLVITGFRVERSVSIANVMAPARASVCSEHVKYHLSGYVRGRILCCLFWLRLLLVVNVSSSMVPTTLTINTPTIFGSSQVSVLLCYLTLRHHAALVFCKMNILSRSGEKSVVIPQNIQPSRSVHFRK